MAHGGWGRGAGVEVPLPFLEALDRLTDHERAPERSPDLRLDAVRDLLTRLDDPHLEVPAIHVAGTKGKGSTAALIESIYRAGGLETGLYLSPHVLDVRERFQVGGTPVPVDDLEEAFEAVWAEVEPRLGSPGCPTVFDVLTAVAFRIFSASGLDVVVVETGLGGRLDSTNVLRPDVSVITRIGRDHTAVLGDDIESIAREKAGIVKEGVPVVTSAREPALATVLEVAGTRDAPVRHLGRDFSFRPRGVSPTGTRFSARTWASVYPRIETSLVGRHQAENATVALAAVDAAGEAGGAKVSREARVRGLRREALPGRCQVISQPVPGLVDGAHTADSAAALGTTFTDLYPDRRAVVVCGAAHDKDLEGLAEHLAPLAGRVVATTIPSPRTAPVERTARAFARDRDLPVEPVPDPEEAIGHALATVGEEEALVVVGSLYLAGVALRYLRRIETLA